MNCYIRGFLFSLILFSSVGMIGCGSRATDADLESDIPDGQVSGSGLDYTDFSDVVPTLPSNLFDSTTTADPVPVAGGLNYQPINGTQQACLTNDNIFLGGLNSMYGGAYSSASCMSGGCDQNAQWAVALSQFAGMDQLLQMVLQMDPNNKDANDNMMAMNFAELILVRGARNQLNGAMGAGQWTQPVMSTMAATDNQLYGWLKSINITGY